jgi:hypothetical protein
VNNSLRATQSCDIVTRKRCKSVLIHVFLLFTYLSTFCTRQQTLCTRPAVRKQYRTLMKCIRQILTSQCIDQFRETGVHPRTGSGKETAHVRFCLHISLGIETVTDIIAKFAKSHGKRLQNHINIEASRLLNVNNITRRLKRKKPFELVRR